LATITSRCCLGWLEKRFLQALLAAKVQPDLRRERVERSPNAVKRGTLLEPRGEEELLGRGLRGRWIPRRC
jgi:hypothetical protein